MGTIQSAPTSHDLQIDVFNNIKNEYGSLALLQCIREINFTIDSKKYTPQAVHEAKKRFYLFKQDRNMANTVYLDIFENMRKVIEHVDGHIGNEDGLINIALQ